MKVEKPASAARLVSTVHEAYGPELHRYLARRLRRPQEAGDLAQEVYLRLLRLGQGELVRKPVAYMYVIASQVAAQFRLQNEQNPVTYDSDVAERLAEHQPEANPDDLTDRVNAELHLKQLLGKLPPMHREVILLRKRDGLSWVEISRRLGISVHTVKKYIYEARARLAAARQVQP
jgi:RNA polymerase sigma-70 factor (ECF subfamily)